MSKKINKTITRIELVQKTTLSSLKKPLLTNLTFNFDYEEYKNLH